MQTLPDYPCHAGGMLIVGINPSPVSVACGHYFQGRLGKRLWTRLQEHGLLEPSVPGEEDLAFVAAGNGLTDLVKRPTARAHELTAKELANGVASLKAKIRLWRPGLILFVYRPPAECLLGKENVRPGRCADLNDCSTFLLAGPYASAAETLRVYAELRQLLKARIAAVK